MKKLVFLGTLGGILILLLVSPVFSILSLRFEREFGGLGTEKGKFGEKISLVFDQEGNIYLLDTNNARVQVLGLNREWIREITSQKEKVTLHSPQDLAVDPKGNLYLVDWNSYPVPRTEKPRIYEYLACIYIFDREGNYLRTITLGEVGKRKGLQPAEVMVDEDGQYTLAIKRGHTRKLKIAVDQESNIFLLDPGANLITKYNFKGEKILSFGKYGDGEGELDDPSDLVVDKEGDVYVADTGNHRIVKFSGEGKYLFSFGQKGRGGAEFTEPFYLAISSQYLFVKDKVQTEVKFEEHPFSEKRGEDFLEGSIIELEKKKEIARLKERVAQLEKKQAEAESEEVVSQEKAPPKYTKVIERVQVFSLAGQLVDKIVYQIDKNDPELHNLEFVAIDPTRQRLFLLNKEKNTLREYRFSSTFFQFESLDWGLSVKPEHEDDYYEVDWADLDEDPDERSERKNLVLKSALSVQYQPTERWNLLLKGIDVYEQAEQKIYNPAKPIYDYEMKDWGNDLVGDLVLSYIINPNAYHYTEARFYTKLLKGFSDYEGKALNPELSRRRTLRTGKASGMLLGLDFDLTPNANLVIEYLSQEPAYLAHNYWTVLYDVEGEEPYGKSRRYNTRRRLGAEFKIKW